MLRAWGDAFMVTMAVEVPIVCLAFRRLPLRTRMLAAVVASGVSHPVMWLTLPRTEPYFVAASIAEVFIVLFEAVVYRAFVRGCYSWWYALVVSAAANATSCLVGLLLMVLE